TSIDELDALVSETTWHEVGLLPADAKGAAVGHRACASAAAPETACSRNADGGGNGEEFKHHGRLTGEGNGPLPHGGVQSRSAIVQMTATPFDMLGAPTKQLRVAFSGSEVIPRADRGPIRHMSEMEAVESFISTLLVSSPEVVSSGN